MFPLAVRDLYRAGTERLCQCNQASDDCEYTPLVTCDDEGEEAENDGPITSEPARTVVELQS